MHLSGMDRRVFVDSGGEKEAPLERRQAQKVALASSRQEASSGSVLGSCLWSSQLFIFNIYL